MAVGKDIDRIYPEHISGVVSEPYPTPRNVQAVSLRESGCQSVAEGQPRATPHPISLSKGITVPIHSLALGEPSSPPSPLISSHAVPDCTVLTQT